MKTEKSLVVLVVTLLCFRDGVVSSGLGKCPKHSYMNNFNISKFTGQWYEIERSFYLMELISSCTTIDLKLNPKKQVEVAVKTYGRLSGRRKISEGVAVPAKRDPSLFIYKVNSLLPNTLVPGTGFYQVLNTDYVNYAILWKCNGFGLLYTDNIWILGRTKEINVKLRAHIYEFLRSKNIDSERLIIPKNNNCTDIFFR